METIKYTFASDSTLVPILLKTSSFRDKLNKVDLRDYTDKLDSLGVIFQCFPKNDPARKVKEYKIIRRNTPKLELYLVLDYDKIRHGTDEENLAHIKAVFKKGCEKFLQPMNGFAWEKFEGEVLERV